MAFSFILFGSFLLFFLTFIVFFFVFWYIYEGVARDKNTIFLSLRTINLQFFLAYARLIFNFCLFICIYAKKVVTLQRILVFYAIRGNNHAKKRIYSGRGSDDPS